MTTETTGAALEEGGPGLTDRQRLAALDAYLKALKPVADALRAKVEGDMAAAHDERVGAHLPDGTKLASITRSDGKKSVKVTDEAALLAWCKKEHPEHVYTVEMVRPAYRTFLTDVAGSLPLGSKGLDPSTGRELPFIEVQQGSPYVTVTATPEGKQRMQALAHGFGRTLGAAPKQAAFPANDPYDPGHGDRLSNGAYG